MKLEISKHRQNWIFAGLLLLVAVLNWYPKTTFCRPGYVHRWRQADCASITYNYYQKGMHFFEPEVHGYVSNGFTNGKAATSEVPTLYYGVAALYKIFGFHEFIYRLLTGLICLLGLFYLFKTIRLLTGDFLWAAMGSLILFTSPVLAYYGNNYLSNAPAFFVVLIAWFFGVSYFRSRQKRHLWVALSLFLLAGTFKITALISFFSLSGVFLLERIKVFSFTGNRPPLLAHRRIWMAGTLIILLAIGGWVLYARQYNLINDTQHFSTRTFPIWKMTPDQRQTVWERVRDSWAKQYFHISYRYALAGMYLFTLVFYKRASRWIHGVTAFLLLGMAVYVGLQFDTFRDHDYYTINLFIVPVFVQFNFLLTLKNRFPVWFGSLYLKLVFAILLAVNVVHAHNEVYNRYWALPEYFHSYTGLHDIEPYLDSIGITREHTLLSVTDDSQASFYLMNRNGVPNYCGWMKEPKDIQRFVDAGIEYLLVIGNKELYNPLWQEFIQDKAGQWKDVYLYHLHKDSSAFVPAFDTLQFEQSFEPADTFTSDPFEQQLLQGKVNDQKAFGGRHSLRIDAQFQDGIRYTFRHLPKGSVLQFEAYTYPKNKWCRFLYCGGMPAIRYERSFMDEVPGAEWNRMRSNLLIPESIPDGDSLTVTLVNVENEPMYLDELTFSVLVPKNVKETKRDGFCPQL